MKRLFLFVLILTLIFIGSACQSNDSPLNMVGSWDITMYPDIFQESTKTHMVTFQGNIVEGTWIMYVGRDNNILCGTYHATGGNVTMIIKCTTHEKSALGILTGEFENEDKISGDFSVIDNEGATIGTWMATRN
jgi:uncharacterized cupin superfamily protein